MKSNVLDLFVPGATVAVGAALLVFWLGTSSPHALEIRKPGQDGSPPAANAEGGALGEVPKAGSPIRGEGRPSAVAGGWLGFRGPKRDGISTDSVRLARSWPPQGPPVLWRVVLGEGYAGAAIRSGCVYVLDYDEGGQTDTLRCLSLDDGREIWRNGYPVQVTRNHGISRTVPALAGDCVITIGPRCHVACWDATTGECRWLMDLVRQYGTQEPRWYTGQCPFIDGDRLILAPCGDALLMAVDSKTGSVIWRTPNPRRWQMTHVSIMPMDVAGRRTYVYCGSGGVAGVAADNGALLWECVEWPVQFAHAPSPLVLPADRILLSSGYGNDVGGLVLQLRATGDKFVAEVAARLTPKQFNSEQQTPILMGDHILGTRKRTAGQLVCLDLRGNEVWNSGSDRFGHGPYLLADGLVLAMDNSGKLTLAEVSSAGYRRLASSQALENGVDAWGPMALVAGRLIVRDMTRMVCLDVGEH